MNQGGFGGGQPPGGYPPGGAGGYPPGGGYPAAGGYGQPPHAPAYGQGYAPQSGGHQPPQQSYPQQPAPQYPGAPGYPSQQEAWGQQQQGWGQQPQQGGYQPPPQQGGYQPPPQPGGYQPQPGGYQPQPQGGWGQPQQGYGPPPGAASGGYGAPQGGFGAPMGALPIGGETRFSFEGNGGELFGKLFVGLLLTGITFGIYGSWFAVGFINYLCDRSVITTPRGPLRVRFNGTGGDLFGKVFVNGLLTLITFGIYFSWAACNMTRYFTDNLQGQTSDGRTYQLRFTGEGGDLFGKALVNGLLMGVTLYIYMPWAICSMRKWFYQKTQIVENGQQVGQLDFVGEGGDLFGTFLVGVILTVLTVGIYGSWFQVSLKKFFEQNTRILISGRTYTMDFTGTGGDLFVLKLVNGLLTGLTLGIYWFWAKVKELQWEYQNTLVKGG